MWLLYIIQVTLFVLTSFADNTELSEHLFKGILIPYVARGYKEA